MLENPEVKEITKLLGDPFSSGALAILRQRLLEESLRHLPIVRVRVILLTKGWCATWQARIDLLHKNMALLYKPGSGKRGTILMNPFARNATPIMHCIDFDKGHVEEEITGLPNLFVYVQLMRHLQEGEVTLIITKRRIGGPRKPKDLGDKVKSFLPGWLAPA